MTCSGSMEKNGVGNTDAHIRKLSLLYSPDLRNLSPAPACELPAAAAFLNFFTGKQS